MVYGIAENKEKIEVAEKSEFLTLKTEAMGKSKFLVLKTEEITMHAADGGLNASVGVTYPTGWTMENCVVISSSLTYTCINGSTNLQSIWFYDAVNMYGFTGTWGFAQTHSPSISLHLNTITGLTKVIGRFVLMRID